MLRFLALSVSLTATVLASCPQLSEVKSKIQDIHDAFGHASHQVRIGGEAYQVHFDQEHSVSAVKAFLDGQFGGYAIHRLQDAGDGRCSYKLQDDYTPATAYLVLKKVAGE